MSHRHVYNNHIQEENHTDTDTDTDTNAIGALQTLVVSLNSKNNDNDDDNDDLDLAKRILSSSIGNVTSFGLTSTSTGGGAGVGVGVGVGVGDSNRKNAGLIKKIERSYRKRIAASASASESVEDKMKQVRLLQKEMSDDGSGMDDEMVSNLLLLFSRLVGSGSGVGSSGIDIRTRSRARMRTGMGIENASSSSATPRQTGGTRKLSSNNARPSSSSSASASASRTKISMPSPLPVPLPVPGKSEHQFQSDKHVELALQNEELNLLRECIHSLQHIDGDLIKFYSNGNNSNSGGRNNDSDGNDNDNGDGEKERYEEEGTSVYNPNVQFEDYNDAHAKANANRTAMLSYNGTRVRPNLLPFNLDVETLVRHRSTRLLRSGAQDALRVCGEAGWLYSRIMIYISNVHGKHGDNLSNDNDNVGGGVVPRALASALMKELNSYHEFLATLEHQLPHNDTNNGGTSKSCDLTLRKLMRTLRGPIAHLRTLALIVDGMNVNLNGGQLLTHLYLHTMHGDTRHKDISTRILYKASLPWYDLLYDWTMGGMLTQSNSNLQLQSPSKSQMHSQEQSEFFIVQDLSVDDANLWHGRYSLKEEQIPHVPEIGSRGLGHGGCGLLSEAMAKEILIVGKGLNFIRKCLHDSEWEFDLRGILPRKLHADGTGDTDMRMGTSTSTLDNQKSSQMKVELGFHYDANSDSSFDMCGRNGEILTQTPIEKTVAIVSSQVHKHILSSLFEQHHLLEHLYGMKEVLFLGQGDFISALMDSLHAEFQSRDSINEIYFISLMNIVHDALRSTNAKFLPKFVTDRIQVRMLSTEDSRNRFWSGDIKESELEGWDIFTLDYAVDTPLTAIVHPKAMEKYYLVFNMLFRLKRVEWMMNNTWRQSTTLNHSLQLIISKFGNVELGPSSRENTLSRMKRLLRKFSMTRQCMLHFLTNLQSYLMFEVLESGWKDLVNKLKRATTLDEVITSHDEYLDEILSKSLVGEASFEDDEGNTGALPNQLRSVLTAAFHFCKMHDKIFSDGVETIQKATEKRRGAQKRSADGEWGFEEFDADVEGLNFKKLANEKILAEVESISEEFDISLRNLLSMLNDRINGNSVRDVDISSPSIARPSQTVKSDRTDANNNDSLRFLTFRLDFSAYYGL